ncbi:MAG TPA: glycosyltransferase [Pyrinomonadaceae bacterium]|nr:glycosyltransferase [Pyrinomonadaceae bacterium]
MKILRIIARLNVGGPARHVVWLSEGLKKMGHETVLVTGVVPPGEDDMGQVAVAAGVKPVTLPEMSREISPKDAIATWKIYRLMLRERPDIVHTHTAKAGTVGRAAGLMYRWLTPSALIGKPRRAKFVHTYHGHVFHSYYGKFRTSLFLTVERVLARLGTDRIIVLSEQQRREIHETFRVGRREQFQIIPLGMDIAAFADWKERRPALRSELHIGANDLLVGIVGRLTEVKNHQMFLQVAARLKQSTATHSAPLRKVRFLIIGDGHLRPELEAQTKQLGLSDDVMFLGTRHDPENFYPALDVVALTSLNEGTPLTLIEGLANARPAIATMVGGVAELLGNCEAAAEDRGFVRCERGIGVRSNDVEGFCQGLSFLLDHETERRAMGERAIEFVAHGYAKERLINDVVACYQELLGAQPALGPQSEEMHVF